MNVGYEDKELESYKEPEQDFSDLKRIGQTDTHTYTHAHAHKTAEQVFFFFYTNQS